MGVSNMLVAIVAMLAFWGTTFGIAYLAITARNRERMELIKNGVDASIFVTQKKANYLNSLKWGLVMVGLGLGIFLGNLFGKFGLMDTEGAVFSMLLVCGGAGLLLFYLISRRQYEAE